MADHWKSQRDFAMVRGQELWGKVLYHARISHAAADTLLAQQMPACTVRSPVGFGGEGETGVSYNGVKKGTCKLVIFLGLSLLVSLGSRLANLQSTDHSLQTCTSSRRCGTMTATGTSRSGTALSTPSSQI